MHVETNQLEDITEQLENLRTQIEHENTAVITDEVRCQVRSLFEEMSKIALGTLGEDKGLDYRPDLFEWVLNVAPRQEPAQQPCRPFPGPGRKCVISENNGEKTWVK